MEEQNPSPAVEEQAAPTPEKTSPKPEPKVQAPEKPASKPHPEGHKEPNAEQPSPKEPKQQPKPARAPEPTQSERPSLEESKPQTQAPAETKQETPKGPCQASGLKIFNRWETTGIQVTDLGLKRYMNLDCMPVPRSGGKYGSGHFTKHKMSLVERFMNRLMIPGHRGKKHKLSSGNHAGKSAMLYNTMKEAFIIMEKRAKKNPLQVLVEAVEHSGPLEEVASYRLGGIIARNSVITSPQRRLDLALRHLTQGIYRTSFRNKKSLSMVIAEELVAASNGDTKSFAVMEKNRMEKESEGAR